MKGKKQNKKENLFDVWIGFCSIDQIAVPNRIA